MSESSNPSERVLLCESVDLDERCQAVLDAMPFYVLLVDENHRILGANQLVTTDLGETPATLCGQFCPRAVHGQDHPYEGCPLEEAVELGRAVERDIWNQESGRWLRSAVYPSQLRDAQGHQIYVHFAQDVTEERQALLRLERSRAHHQALADLLEGLQTVATAEAVLSVLADLTMSLDWMGVAYGASGFLVSGDGGLERVMTRNLDEETLANCARGNPTRCLCGHVARTREIVVADRAALTEQWAGVASPSEHAHGHATLPLVHDGETLAVVNFYLRSGSQLDSPQVAFLKAAAGVAAVSLARIRARQEARQARAEKRDIERKLFDRVVRSQEEERRRVARELHDDLGQALSAVLLEIQAEPGTKDRWFVGYRRRLDRSIRGVIDKVSHLAWELRPSILDDYGLGSAVERYVERLRGLSGLDIDFQRVVPPGEERRLPSEVEVVLYRIMQEALTNVVRHADAHRVSVVLVRRRDQVALLVEDDGQGFSPEVEARRRGERCLGLLGMQERVALLRGSLRIESAPGRGVTVKASIPLTPEEEEEHADPVG